MFFKDFLALLHRGGSAPERQSYLHQTEMHMHFPDLLNMTKAPSWIPDKVWLKEVNLWMSSGGTVTSLHMDTSENVRSPLCCCESPEPEARRVSGGGCLHQSQENQFFLWPCRREIPWGAGDAHACRLEGVPALSPEPDQEPPLRIRAGDTLRRLVQRTRSTYDPPPLSLSLSHALRFFDLAFEVLFVFSSCG